MKAPRSRGATLVEVVIAMVIVVILAAMAYLSYNPNPIKARYQAERLRADLRHAQMLATSTNAVLRFTVTAGTPGSYAVSTVGGIGTGACTTAALTDPATGTTFSVTPDPALTLAVVSGPASVDFDTLGSPAACAGNPCSCPVVTATNPVASYSIAGGGTTYVVGVTRYSGFATIAP